MENARDALKWLVEEWASKLAGILESMTDLRPETTWDAVSLDGVSVDSAPGAEIPENSLVWRQILSLSPEPAVWIAAPEPVWRDLGSRTLQAAGVENVEPSDARNTWLEIVNQSVAALTPELSRRARRDIVCEKGDEAPEGPPQLRFIRVEVTYGEERLPLFIAFSSLLIAAADTSGKTEDEARAEEAEVLGDALIPQLGPQPAGIAKTFDLLLEVALPVSISFGRTQLPIRDVLKLTTGSIVELNRTVTEPVEVIVNDCVIARGEVVVVEGNYGVRIRQIISREERFRTGTISAHRSQKPAQA
ncbi:MAG: flagellar motor switch protein FliN [Acidobacteriota bacterium]|nr:flagellar motor switch protein FliN [Acidobacteriota bacterium]